MTLAALGSAGLHIGLMLCLSGGGHEPSLPKRAQSTQVVVRTLPASPIRESAVIALAPATTEPPLAAETDPQQQTPQTSESSERQPAQESAPPPDTQPDYWPRKWLTASPTPLEPPLVLYPESETQGQTEGWVILELFISASGHVDKIDVLTSEAPEEFIESARRTFLQAPFTPGLKDNVAVPSRIKIEVRFEQR